MADGNSVSTGFFYGTLMSPSVLSRVLYGEFDYNRTLADPVPALLQDHQRHKVRGCDYPAMIPKSNASVRGVLLAGLTDADWWRLDAFEGSDYKRILVKVCVSSKSTQENVHLDGHVVLAQTYIWIADSEDLEDAEWDFDEFVKEKMWRWAGSEAENQGEYADLDGAVAVLNDPTGGRHINGGAITDALKENQRQKIDSQGMPC